MENVIKVNMYGPNTLGHVTFHWRGVDFHMLHSQRQLTLPFPETISKPPQQCQNFMSISLVLESLLHRCQNLLLQDSNLKRKTDSSLGLPWDSCTRLTLLSFLIIWTEQLLDPCCQGKVIVGLEGFLNRRNTNFY